MTTLNINKPLTSVLIKYNNKEMGTWLKHSNKTGNDFYSLTLLSNEIKNISFVLATKFVFRDEKLNSKNNELGNQNIYIMNEWKYSVNVYDKETKQAQEKIVDGTTLVELIKKHVKGALTFKTKAKNNNDIDVEASLGI